MTRQDATATKFIYPRVCAIIGYRQTSLAKVTAAACDGEGQRWSERHVIFVLQNERQGSAELHGALRRVLGEPAWRYVTGQSNRFPSGRAPAARPSARAAA